MKIWDAVTGIQVLTFEEDRPVRRVAWSPDGLLLASSDSDQTIRIRDATTGCIAGYAPIYLPVLDQRIQADPAVPAAWRLRAEIRAAGGDWDGAASDLYRYHALKTDEHWSTIGYWVAGPYPEGLGAHYAPEWNSDPAKQVASFAQTETSPTLINWQRVPFASSGFVNFGELMGNAEHISAYALLRIFSPHERPVAILLGADNQVRIWLNDKQIYEALTRHAADPGPDAVSAILRPGWNTLLARVVHEKEDHTLYLRLSDLSEDLSKVKSQSAR